jgi:hypothetical protein
VKEDMETKDDFNPFETGISILPGQNNTFVVIEGDYNRDRDRGFMMKRTWGFSCAEDLLKWLQSFPHKIKSV